MVGMHFKMLSGLASHITRVADVLPRPRPTPLTLCTATPAACAPGGPARCFGCCLDPRRPRRDVGPRLPLGVLGKLAVDGGHESGLDVVADHVGKRGAEEPAERYSDTMC